MCLLFSEYHTNVHNFNSNLEIASQIRKISHIYFNIVYAITTMDRINGRLSLVFPKLLEISFYLGSGKLLEIRWNDNLQ